MPKCHRTNSWGFILCIACVCVCLIYIVIYLYEFHCCAIVSLRLTTKPSKTIPCSVCLRASLNVFERFALSSVYPHSSSFYLCHEAFVRHNEFCCTNPPILIFFYSWWLCGLNKWKLTMAQGDRIRFDIHPKAIVSSMLWLSVTSECVCVCIWLESKPLFTDTADKQQQTNVEFAQQTK